MSTDTIELELIVMAHGGQALGRYQNKTVFVPYAIPGEHIEARIVQDKGRIAFAEGVTLLEASADRVYPRCRHFGPGRCSRCQWQHIDYPAQLLLKQDVLADQLARIGGFDDVPVEAVVPAPEIWHYNQHITLLADAQGIPGLPATEPGRLIVPDECPVIHPELLAIYEALDLKFDGLRQLQLQRGSDGEIMLILSMVDDNAPELLADLPASINMLLNDNEPVNLIGQSHTRYKVGERGFRVTAGSYFRPHIAQLDTLAQYVRDVVLERGAQTVLDLYGGVGLFSAYLAEHVSLVTLVDSYPPAVTDAESNLDAYDNIDLIEGSVEDVLPQLEDTYDATIVDPPLDGLSVEAVDMLLAYPSPILIYISGDPATLARDAQRLTAGGYTLAGVQPFDLAPHTYYIDSVALFRYTP